MNSDPHFFITSRSNLQRMGNILENNCRENKNTHFMFNKIFFENCADDEVIWRNILTQGRPKMTI